MKILQTTLLAVILTCSASLVVYAGNDGALESKPKARFRHFYEQRAYPHTVLPSNILAERREEYLKSFSGKSSAAQVLSQQPEWRQIGPYNVGGRVRSVVHHPKNDGWVYIGAAGGGVWRTTDGGETWTPLMDYVNSIELGALAIDPKNPDILYAGTGEMRSGSYSIAGAGMYKTEDAGKTWNVIGLTTVGSFSKIYVHPKNSDLVVAGGADANGGFYKSTDAGKTWNRTLKGTVSDISINPNDETEFFIGVSGEGVYRSNDGGETWTLMEVELGTQFGRISVQQCASETTTLYMLAQAGETNSGVVYKSLDNGVTWVRQFASQNIFGANSQGDYDNVIQPNPTDPNNCLVGGINLFYTGVGGVGGNWEVTAGYGFGLSSHPDMHVVTFSPFNSNVVYLGCDGGMYKSEDAGYTWRPINTGLSITQFHGIGVDHSKKNVNYGGTQDNGTISNSSNNYGDLFGGDGSHAIVDPINTNTIWGGTQYGGIFKVNSSTGSAVSYANAFGADQGAFVAPLEMDPTDNNTVYSGRSALWATFNAGGKWSSISPSFSSKISTIAISPLNPGIIYVGTSQGQVFLTTVGGDESWTDLTYNGLPNRFVADIECSNEDENTAFAVFSGFNSSHVFKTTDLGKTWTDIGKGLPDIPTNAIIVNPDDERNIFVGTDFGVFATYNSGETWFPYGVGLPNTMVVDMSFYLPPTPEPDKLTLRVGTHGRSMWEVDVIASDPVANQEITAPNGGEVYVASTNHHISWYGFTPPVRVEYSLDDGAQWFTLAENASGNSLRWIIPNRRTFTGRIRVTSAVNPSEMRISSTFTIEELRSGSVTDVGSVSHVPYGLAWDGKNGLWTTSFYDNQLVKLNANTLLIEKSVRMKQGDSLFTDLTFDRSTGTLYIHKLNSSTPGNGGVILVADTNGNVSRTMKSPAAGYPIGLEYVKGSLVVGDRDGERNLYAVNPETGEEESKVRNPFQVALGPRCICFDGDRTIYQASTAFPGNSLKAAYAVKMDIGNLSFETGRFELASGSGIINARGIEYDPRDKNFWVSDFGGSIYKIAGFEVLSSTGDREDSPAADLSVYPNPSGGTTYVSFVAHKSAASLKVEVVDLLGRSTMNLFSGSVEIGEGRVLPFDASRLPGGVYTIVLSSGDSKRLVKTLAVIK